MDKETLIAYIQTERARGVADADIKTELLTKGWSEEMVSIELGENTKNSSALPPVMELISASFSELWRNIWKSFLIMLLPFLVAVTFGFMGGAGMILSGSQFDATPGVIVLTVVMVVIAGLFSLVSTIMLVKQIENNWTLTFEEALKRSFPLLLPLLFVSILGSIAVLGGILLLIIPGIVAALWFVFTQTAVIIDEKRGLSALLYSKKLVTENFSIIFKYFIVAVLLVMLVSFIAGLIPVAEMFIGFFTTPFMLIFTVRVYAIIKKQQTETAREESRTAVYALLAVGTLLIIGILCLLLFGLLVLPPL